MKTVTAINESKKTESKDEVIRHLDISRALVGLLHTVSQGSEQVDNADLLMVTQELSDHMQAALEAVENL